MNRENGFYWVKLSGHWTVAHWDGENYWGIIGFEDELRDVEFDEINETEIIKPVK